MSFSNICPWRFWESLVQDLVVETSRLLVPWFAPTNVIPLPNLLRYPPAAAPGPRPLKSSANEARRNFWGGRFGMLFVGKHMWPWVKIQIVPPVNLPIPTKKGSKMGGEFTYPKNGIPLGFGPRPYMFCCRKPAPGWRHSKLCRAAPLLAGKHNRNQKHEEAMEPLESMEPLEPMEPMKPRSIASELHGF